MVGVYVKWLLISGTVPADCADIVRECSDDTVTAYAWACVLLDDHLCVFVLPVQYTVLVAGCSK